jgi:hypothetical protein
MVNQIHISKIYYKLNKFLFFIFTCTLFLILFYSCSTQKRIIRVESTVYLNYDKVKINCTINESKIKLNGFINQILDTTMCYRFWGPLGFEIGRGHINEQFPFYDAINKVNYTNIKDKLESIAGIFLNKSVFFALLSGQTDSLANKLIALNGDIVIVKELKPDYLFLENKISRNTISFKYKYANNNLKFIIINSISFRSKFDLHLEIVEISRNKKICKF